MTNANKAHENMNEDNKNQNTDAQAQAETAGAAQTSDQAQQQSGDVVAALQSEIAAMKDQMLRALAEAENTRRRAQKEREDAGKYAVTSFARDMLNVADNFRRALDAVPAEMRAADDQVKNLLAGVEATEKELLSIFERHGIKKINPMGEIFDPNFHEVMFEADDPSKPGGTITQVLDAGYVLNGRLLRPARVGVAKGAPTSGGNTHQIDEKI